MDAQVIEQLKAGIEFERTRTGPPEGFPQLPDIPAGRYTDPEFLRLEQAHLWKKAWLYAGHVDELPEAGSFKLWRRTGSPIVILRDNDNHIRAFYNTCRHRGGPLVKEESGTLPGGLVCGFHGWTYTLAGELVSLRDQRDFVGLDMSCRSLIPVRCERLGNWIFINEDADAPALADTLGPIHDYFCSLPLDTLRLVSHQTFDVNCNVKTFLETFLEVYHLKSTHPQTVDRFLDHRGTHIILWPRGHSLMLSPNRRPGWVDPGAQGMPEMAGATELEREASPSFNIFPNLVTPVSPTGLPFNLIWPVSERRSLLEVIWFAPDWGGGARHDRWDTRLRNYERILGEDLAFIEQMQASIESAGFHGVPLNYQERRIYHWHEELDRRIGADHIPASLRVAPVLDNWVREGWT
ncbi:MAG: aromatic ring-hydroxylating dioxygenase subunit alpha [Gammaproteobacteria bacterium]|nr:MAG: aromatic ring-hydroxylating dioxygenase subunit alpha [Gammaproteobacteria bacterium]